MSIFGPRSEQNGASKTLFSRKSCASIDGRWRLRSVYAAVMISALFAVPLASAQSIFWTDAGTNKIYTGNLNGSGSPIELFPSQPGRPGGIAVDSSNGKLFWGTNTPFGIFTGNGDGSGAPVELFGAADSGDLHGTVMIDTVAGKIYWSELQSIRVGNLDGSGAPVTLFDSVTDGVDFVVSLARDSIGGRLYWCEFSDNQVRFGNDDGSGSPATLFDASDGILGPNGLDISLADGMVYWSERLNNRILSGNIDGTGTPIVLFDGVDGVLEPSDVILDSAAGKIYWANTGGSEICVGNADGSGSPSVIFDASHGLVSPLALAIASATMPIEQPSLVVTDATIFQEGQSSFALRLENLNPAWSGVNATIDLPEGIQVTSASVNGGLSQFALELNPGAPGTQASALLYSPIESFADSDLDAITFQISASSDAPLGDHEVRILLSGLSDNVGSAPSIAHVPVGGTITIESGLTLFSEALPLQPMSIVIVLGLVGLLALWLARKPGSWRIRGK